MKGFWFLLSIILVSINFTALPNKDMIPVIKQKTSFLIDEKYPMPVMPKDSYATAAGFKSILQINGDFRGFAPVALNNSEVSEDGDTIQVICAKANGSDLSGFSGVYYTFSFNGGATWSIPELITSTGPFTRNYCEIAVSEGQYPYVVTNYRNASYSGDWFTTDPLSPGSGAWTTPILITDTINYAAYMPTVAVNKAGDKVTVIAYDLEGGIGSNYSSDFGMTWETYNLSSSIGDSVLKPDVSCARWGIGDSVHALIGMSWTDEVRGDIAGVDTATFNGYSISTDAGASWSAPIGLFSSNKRPNIKSINGDTFTYYIDTIKGNGTADSFPVECYLDESTGFWADSRGDIDSEEFGFGTWWYWWDAEYFEDVNTFFYAIPMTDLFFDYYVQTGGDLYTFPWQGQSLLFGFKKDNLSKFVYEYIDLHDDEILDSTGRTATWRGNVFSANIVYDHFDHAIYIIYQDYVDATVGESSIEALRIESNSVYRATISLNAASYIVEAPSYVTEDGYVHITICPGSLDSIYYKAIDLYDPALEWTYLGFSQYPINDDDIYPPLPFDLVSPSGIITDSTPTFIWRSSEGAVMCDYSVYINDSLAATVTDTTWTLAYPIPQGEHTWYVIVTDYLGLSTQSSQTDTFIYDTEPPSAPALVSPLDNSQSHYPSFTWRKAADNLSKIKEYVLWYDYDSIFSSPDSVISSDTTCTASMEAHQYYWKVKAIDYSDNIGAWSDVWYFIYAPTGTADELTKKSADEFATDLSVALNEVRYSAVTADNEFTIYDIAGKAIYEKKGFKKGVYKCSTKNLKSGIYFIKFRDSDITINKRAVIIK